MNELLCKLSGSFGPSGLEDETAGIIYNELSSFCDKTCYTPLGSVCGIIKGKSGSSPLMVCSDIDETSFIVSSIDDDGFVRIKELTRTNPGALSGQFVTVGNEEHRLNGIMAGKVLHLASGADRENPNCDKMFIDVGESKKDDVSSKIAPGDFVTFSGSVEEFGKGKLMGKALSVRANCFEAIECARKLKESGDIPERDIIFFFNTKSKVGSSDLFSAIYKFAPEKVLVLSAIDSFCEKDKETAELGKGIALPLKDGFYLYFGSEMFKNALALDIKTFIPEKVSDNEGSSRDGISGEGAKLLRVCLPVKNMNSAREIISLSDLEEEEKLILAFCRSKI